MLCASTSPAVVETVGTGDIIALYRTLLGIDVSDHFSTMGEIALCRCHRCDLQFFWPPVMGSERFYAALQDLDAYYLDEKDEYTHARRFIRPTDRVLEIGCGTGTFARGLPSSDYLGLETNAKAAALARRDGLTVQEETIEEHAPLHPGRYDVVCAFQVLEHVADVRRFIHHSLACLKPGGLLIYSVPSADGFLGSATNAVLNLPPHHCTRWTDEALRAIPRPFGLELVGIEHERLGNRHRRWYAHCLVLRSLQGLLGLRDGPRLVDLSLRHRVMSKVASLGARVVELGLAEPPFVPAGHSVSLVCRKPLSAPETSSAPS